MFYAALILQVNVQITLFCISSYIVSPSVFFTSLKGLILFQMTYTNFKRFCYFSGAAMWWIVYH